MTCMIASLEQDHDQSWRVLVRKSDGTETYVRLASDCFVNCGTMLMGQIVLQVWLTTSEGV